MRLFISNPPMILSASSHPDPLRDLNLWLLFSHTEWQSHDSLLNQSADVYSWASKDHFPPLQVKGHVTLITQISDHRDEFKQIGHFMEHTFTFWLIFWCFHLFSESVSVGIPGSRCGGIKASAHASWSRQSSSFSSSPAFISHCECFKTNPTWYQMCLWEWLMGVWPPVSTHTRPAHLIIIIHTFLS